MDVSPDLQVIEWVSEAKWTADGVLVGSGLVLPSVTANCLCEID